MSDVQLALNGASFEGLVKIAELPGQGMITLRGDLTDTGIAQSVKDVFGVTMPGTRGTAIAGESGALWMSPDEALLLCPYASAQEMADTLAQKLTKVHALVVNVSDARSAFELRGSALREVIAKLAPVDMSPEAFQPGQVRRTRFAQVAGAVWMTDASTARVVCFRSVAAYMFGILSHAADENAHVGYF